MSVRVEIAGVVVRLFSDQESAVKAAKAREKIMRMSYAEERVRLGWVVKHIVSDAMYDDGGEVPEKAAKALRAQHREDRQSSKA